MQTRIRSIIDNLTANSKRLFLIDGSGAFLTAFFLFAILVRFEDSFGMPRRILYFLSFVACIYTIYSFSCYFLIFNKWRPFLKAIILANIIYCFITIGLVIYFYQNLTILGLIYFFLEVIVMSSLIFLELMVVAKS